MTGRSDKAGGIGRGGIIGIAAGAAVLWCALYAIVLYPGAPGAGALLAAVLPLVLIGAAAVLALGLEALRDEAAALRDDRDRLRAALQAAGQTHSMPQDVSSDANPPPAATARERARPGNALEPSAQQAARRDPPASRQRSLPLDPSAGPVPEVTLPDLIRALHFPETPEDRDGLRALQKALRDHKARLVVQAAQDMLTLLSQDGIYMDDLAHDRADPDLWRRFAAGDRARAVAAVGGIHDPAALARCRDKLQRNTVYRDTAHHFLRRFDQTLGGIAPQLGDDGLIALSETRSARAFMLVGRAAGVFGDMPDRSSD
jgi:hypothetical protein